MRILFLCLMMFGLVACKEEEQASEPPIRGLKTHLVSDAQNSTVRRFPAVLEPTSLNTLSFEVAGKLGTVELEVGERVAKGQVLLTLDTTSFQTQLDNAEAGIAAAQATYDNAADNLARQEKLLEQGTTTRVGLDNARTEAIASKARLDQAMKSRDSARETLEKTTIVAPIDGIINSVEAVSFSTVSPGVPRVITVQPKKSPRTLSRSLLAKLDD